jgi:hypothetical protein
MAGDFALDLHLVGVAAGVAIESRKTRTLAKSTKEMRKTSQLRGETGKSEEENEQKLKDLAFEMMNLPVRLSANVELPALSLSPPSSLAPQTK